MEQVEDADEVENDLLDMKRYSEVMMIILLFKKKKSQNQLSRFIFCVFPSSVHFF